jgi:Amt family ammonium transporter
MFAYRNIVRYGAIASILYLALLATGPLRAEDASPAASAAAPAGAQAPTPAPTPVAPDSTGTVNNAGTGVDLTWPAPAKADPKSSLSTGEPTIDDAGKTTAGAGSELVKNVAHNKISINIVWTLITGFLVMFMQAGFALVETGLCRAKNAAHVMSTNS